MNVIDEEDTGSSSSSFEDCSTLRQSIFDPTRSYGPRSTAQDEALERALRFSTFVSAYEEPSSKNDSLRVPFLSDGNVFARTGGRRHSQANRDEETQPVSRKSIVRVTVDDSVLPLGENVEMSPMERKAERPGEQRKNPTVEMFPLLVRGLETNKSGEILYKRSDSAFEVKNIPDSSKRDKEDENADKDDGKTGGSLNYKAKVEYLLKLAIGNPKPQDVVFKLLNLQANTDGPDTGINSLMEVRNHMKDKELLAAAGRELGELNGTYQALTAEKEQLEVQVTALNASIENTTNGVKTETENIVSKTFSIKDAHRRHAILSAEVANRIADQTELHSELENHLEAEKYTSANVGRTLNEAWERVDMRQNELETVLAGVNERTERMREKAGRCSRTIEEIKGEKQRQRIMEEKLHSALGLLKETMQYVQEFTDREDFIDEYVEELKLLQQECLEAAEAERRFEEQARTDPRKLLPYSRSTVTSTLAKF